MSVDSLRERYHRVRNHSLEMVALLSEEEFYHQAVQEVSPPAWNLGHTNWFFDAVDWQAPSNGRQPVTRLFDLETDPDCRVNIAGNSPQRVALARERILADAGGHLNYYERQDSTDALGRPQFSSR